VLRTLAGSGGERPGEDGKWVEGEEMATCQFCGRQFTNTRAVRAHLKTWALFLRGGPLWPIAAILIRGRGATVMNTARRRGAVAGCVWLRCDWLPYVMTLS